jgi:ATP-binding cassette subfamily F protein 3
MKTIIGDEYFFPVSKVPGYWSRQLPRHMAKNYSKDISLFVERGSKLPLLVKSWQGKSTFIKAIVNEFKYSGEIKGHNVQVGYFAQNRRGIS